VYIWNAHWNTFGGGEVYAGKVAEVLSATGYKVTLLGYGNLNRHEIKNRLGVDFENIDYVKLNNESDIIDHVGIDDIFINGSFGSTFRSPTTKSIYIVHFPSKKSKNHLHALLNRFETLEVLSTKGQAILLTGFLDLLIGAGSIKVPKSNKVALTSLYGEISVSLTSGKTFKLSHNMPLEFEGREHIQVKQLGDLNSVLSIESTNYPNMILQSIRNRLSQSSQFIRTYSQIWANSIFTQEYIQLYWDQQSSVVYPPVKSIDSFVVKRNPYQITSVGRFMSPKDGHSKNQHLLIKAFESLCESSNKPWTLNLIGGV
jgi:glycosyltransferase involved in cell wall biosynthesis